MTGASNGERRTSNGLNAVCRPARSTFVFRRSTVGAAATLLLAACGGSSKHLEGSLSTLVDLEYDKAELVQSEDEFALRFIKKREVGEDTPLKVSYSLSGTAITTNSDMDLAEDKPAGGERTTVTREVLDDPRSSFPRITRGAVKFFSVPQPGGRVKGELHFTFEQGTEFGCGRTVFGPFEAVVP